MSKRRNFAGPEYHLSEITWICWLITTKTNINFDFRRLLLMQSWDVEPELPLYIGEARTFDWE